MQRIRNGASPRVTVVGGGFAGLVAAVTCAEAGARVRLLEAHRTLGGRARATTGPYVAHDGPHVLYRDGPWWRWLADRDLIGAAGGVPAAGLAGFRFRRGGRLRRTPPAALLPVLAARRRRAPVDADFRTWIRDRHGDPAADAAANLMGVATFDADPGRLSAAFVWPRLLRVFAPNPPAQYVTGGWNGLVDRLAAHARTLGGTGRPSTGATACTSPGTWSPRPGCSARCRSTAR
ncbi:NAD(P)-binding protein [Dactylosporangium aurantiacum]|uniref:NAD(P)-binding protein n=1 Tax=Dactylosporangium aurantiacum TaxID=35754 RepID=A0A9Q9MJJ6_9ACTN|nr:NAD(P)/FAD-dependent oxidoreductase [Dactylosporangium aurantiacum]MDG6108664.1 NAD(P)-binding protein [Dactylosporangium aurantiacum]UWZ59124.1 NAD(P)-binding protein [Dactylosporangium aurantiacum]